MFIPIIGFDYKISHFNLDGYPLLPLNLIQFFICIWKISQFIDFYWVALWLPTDGVCKCEKL